jgi:hypothetical protein
MKGIQRLLQIKLSDLYFERVVNALKVRMMYLPQAVIWFLPWGFNRRNREKLKELNGIHSDKKRCFIIASGPSLKNIDFKLLENEITIAMNRSYLMKKQLNFMPNYLFCIDIINQLKQFTSDFDAFDEIPTFYNWDFRSKLTEKNNRYLIKTRFSPNFLTKLPGFFGNGRSVTYTCIQLAFIMGFKEVYLIGKDHNYNSNSKAGKELLSNGNDGNHFLKGYYNKGQVYAMPDYAGEEFAYKIGKEVFEKNNRIIFDATINGKLEIFKKIDFYSLF